MIVIPPELYTKLKDNFNNDAELSHLDKSMKEILKNKKLSDHEKWYVYRQNLVKFANKKRKHLQQKPQLQQNPYTVNSVNNKKILSTKTKLNIPQVSTRNKKIQTELSTKEIGLQYYPPEDEMYTFEPPKKINSSDSGTDDEVFDNNDEIRKIALSATPAGKRIKERKSKSSSDVRMFETDEGDIITVPIFERPKKDTSINRQLRSSTKPNENQSVLNFPIRKKNISKLEKDKTKPPSALDIAKWKSYR